MKERPQLIGVQSETSPYAHQVYYSGTQTGVTETESIAEGLAGEIAHDSITIPLMRRFVDDIVLVSEEEIRLAIRYCWKKYGVRIEGSAAVGLAARLAGKIQLFPAALILTGGNIQSELFNEIIHSK
jgi:threonine dehydratase